MHQHRIRNIFAKNKSRLPMFVLAFAVVGTALLIASRAATSSNVSLEAENGTVSGGALVTTDTSASGSKAVKFAHLTTLKPQVKGAVDRDGYDTSVDTTKTNLRVPATYQSIVNNFVLMVDWSKLQPTSSTSFNTAIIDDAISEAKAKDMRIKLRVLSGIHAPTWVKNIDGGPFDVYDIDGTTGEVFTGTSPKYWTDNYRTAYTNLMTKLADKYDNEDTILSVANSMCTTIFAEPFIKNLDEGNNMTSFFAAGMTTDLDKQCHNNSIDVHAAWKRTRTETALNPLSYKGVDTAGNPIEKFDPDFTIAWVRRCRSVLGDRCIMGNNGFNATAMGLNLRKVIGEVICQGNPPNYYQTRQQAVIVSSGKTLADVLKYAVDAGAGMVELPVQYRTTAITPEALAPYDTALEKNNAIPCPADRLVPNPS